MIKLLFLLIPFLITIDHDLVMVEIDLKPIAKFNVNSNDYASIFNGSPINQEGLIIADLIGVKVIG